MARTGQTHESERRETVDPTSGGGRQAAGGGHLGSYLGLAIAAAILLAMLFLQNMLAADL